MDDIVSTEKKTILLIGHLTDHPSGSALLFRQLVEGLRKYNMVEIAVVNTARPPNLTSNQIVNLIVALRVTLKIIGYLGKVDVVTFHASQPAMMSYAPILYILSRLFRRPLVLRLFGGTLEQEYETLSRFRKWIFDKTVLATVLLLLETKYLVGYFVDHGAKNVKWYANSRPLVDLSDTVVQNDLQCRCLIFLGRVIEEKGIGVILNSVTLLNPGVSVDIYGPLDGQYTAEQINAVGKGIIRYRGVLTLEEVNDILFDYDALILPTFYLGEGYPGVILEAYSHGLPVIATDWRAIPEIVDEESGILIPTHSPQALADAMNSLSNDPDFYARLCQGARVKRTEFSEKVWTDRFVEWCYALVNHAR